MGGYLILSLSFWQITRQKSKTNKTGGIAIGNFLNVSTTARCNNDISCRIQLNTPTTLRSGWGPRDFKVRVWARVTAWGRNGL